eukprot:5605793-Prymnesium_polylepis.1
MIESSRAVSWGGSCRRPSSALARALQERSHGAAVDGSHASRRREVERGTDGRASSQACVARSTQLSGHGLVRWRGWLSG